MMGTKSWFLTYNSKMHTRVLRIPQVVDERIDPVGSMFIRHGTKQSKELLQKQVRSSEGRVGWGKAG